MYEDHLKTCEYCRKINKYRHITNRQSSLNQHPVIVKIRNQQSQLNQHLVIVNERNYLKLGAIMKGISYPSMESIPMFRTKELLSVVGNNIARKPGPIEREVKTLRHLEK